MHTSYNRRTATKVRRGRVQRKNRHRPTSYKGYVLDRQSPGRGSRHVVTKRDLRAFIEIIPEWERFSERLRRIVLAKRDEDYDGLCCFYHREETGAIFLTAWDRELWQLIDPGYFYAHRRVLERLGVSHDRLEGGVMCRFTLAQARAFMLLHVFMHELGHHYDHICQKHLGSSTGEAYAENFAMWYFEQLLPAYVQVFGDPARAS